MSNDSERGTWASGAGFVLAAAGSAVGLGNVWRFPYITGENGGGLFVLLYLGCILLVGLPIMIGEIMLGRATQSSPVGAFKELAGKRSSWVGLGWLGVIAAFMILSFYAVIAGWAMHYVVLSARGALAGLGAEEIQAVFGNLAASGGLSTAWLIVFMGLTMAVVLGGVEKGIERWARILMPALILLLVALMVRGFALDGFREGLSFVFGFHAEQLTAGGVLEALGHSFFTLSLGMGAMLTYGSYLSKRSPILGNAVAISLLDTLIALLACMVLFPYIFSFGLEPNQGAGLIFTTLPVAFAQMPAGSVLATLFFVLLVFAALTSAISLLEVAATYFIDERGWTRRKAVLLTGVAITLLGIPSALTGSSQIFGSVWAFNRDWFNLVADTSSNVMLPLGGLGIALFVGWRLDEVKRREQFGSDAKLVTLYKAWLAVLRFLVPIAVVLVFLNAIGLF